MTTADAHPLARLIRNLVDQELEAYRDQVERACEVSITTGLCGVSITHYLDGGYEVKVDPDVPYGRIHERRHVTR